MVMGFDIQKWVRYDSFGVPVYINPDKPSWFVPNGAGEKVLSGLVKNRRLSLSLSEDRFLERIHDPGTVPYAGRGDKLVLTHIRELWFHVTDQCNLKCTHCLFSSGPGVTASLDVDFILKTASEAYDAGCRVFALTGGEPFVHKDIGKIINGLLSFAYAHVMVLTNGKNMKSYLSCVQADMERLHFQISVDGLEKNHDSLRGKGAFKNLIQQFEWMKENKIPFTISMCPTLENYKEMPEMVKFATKSGASNLHFMWYFIRGRARDEHFVQPEKLFPYIKEAYLLAEESGIGLDNIDALKTQVFAPPGTIHDGSTTAWESLAVGPDGFLYPSPALIGVDELKTDLSPGLCNAWKNGKALTKIRNSSVAGDTGPLRFLTGGGDCDHSYIHAQSFSGDDPYLLLIEKIVLWLISREAKRVARNKAGQNDLPGLMLKMGDLMESCGAHGSIALTHPNCLLAVAGNDSRSVVKAFYSKAAENDNLEILNPVCYEESLISHIPEKARFRGYGCGSPVIDAGINSGEHVVDLGSGRGVECFIAAKITGNTGRVTGIDMLDPMLELAKQTCGDVTENLGYSNLEFRKGLLEKLPLEDECADVVISNCVINLSVNKRDSFYEIFRVLKEGGRLVISDVVCDDEPGAFIKNDKELRGACIAGAMTWRDLAGILEETGFLNISIKKRFPYREVQGHSFFSVTYEAFKAKPAKLVRVIYTGPFKSVETSRGDILPAGMIREIYEDDAGLMGESLYILDESGAVTNQEYENTCCSCASPSEEKSFEPLMAGCMVCGAPLDYFAQELEKKCAFCDQIFLVNASCENGHFVCDTCHSKDAVEVMLRILINSVETDMLALLCEIRKHPAIPLHGPEHHALVPGVILTAFRNSGGDVGAEHIERAVRRGNKIAGGNCAFNGVCGAAEGTGIGFSVILDANPLKAEERQVVQTVSYKVLKAIAEINAPRCCQRECWIALTRAAELSAKFLPIALKADHVVICTQKKKNTECVGNSCPVSGFKDIKVSGAMSDNFGYVVN